jgi:hypothetical protein
LKPAWVQAVLICMHGAFSFAFSWAIANPQPEYAPDTTPHRINATCAANGRQLLDCILRSAISELSGEDWS